ncbi:MAG TPA: 16S rRNA (guanine(527)-N(7))-methyltransferase RsmG [Candidatus Sulfotelmatobacter sp.]|nr:16S rRNA (guanine(527)-N(7))-methyltransferase RsmG [Candidatus Sulfotelmatobacter sp.]
MTLARIAELLQPFLDPANGQQLTSNDLQNISTYIDILQRWNFRINLTAIRDEEQIITRHFGESLFAARHLFPKSSVSSVPSVVKDFEVADVGSGAGFPGVPMKLWSPTISLTLIESNQKKATFLREVARALTLTDINIQTTRAETLPPHAFDVVTLRAVERFESILPVAANLVRAAGSLALLIGCAQEPQARLILPSLLWSHPIPIPNSRSRILLLAESPIPSGT